VRIALVHSYYSSRVPSGENNVVDAQAAALREAGHEVLVVAQSTDQRLGRRTYPIEAALTVATGVGPSPARALATFRPDVVHVHNLFPNFGRHWVTSYDGPLVATLHNYRPICPAATLFRDGAVCRECPESRSTRPAVRHACFHGSAVATLAPALGTHFAADPLLRRAHVLTTLSDGMSAEYAAAGVPADKLRVLGNFVPDLAGGATPAPAERSWLYAGRIEREKGLHQLIERWPAGERLLVAGAPDPADPLPHHRDVELLGRVDQAELVKRMASATGLVFPSIWLEGLALVCLEALSAGLPVLAFDDVPAGRTVEDLGIGVTGPRADVDSSCVALPQSSLLCARTAATSTSASSPRRHGCAGRRTPTPTPDGPPPGRAIVVTVSSSGRRRSRRAGEGRP
jgi:glycosyltransferase involved in cell wall biosynthesis